MVIIESSSGTWIAGSLLVFLKKNFENECSGQAMQKSLCYGSLDFFLIAKHPTSLPFYFTKMFSKVRASSKLLGCTYLPAEKALYVVLGCFSTMLQAWNTDSMSTSKYRNLFPQQTQHTDAFSICFSSEVTVCVDRGSHFISNWCLL